MIKCPTSQQTWITGMLDYGDNELLKGFKMSVLRSQLMGLCAFNEADFTAQLKQNLANTKDAGIKYVFQEMVQTMEEMFNEALEHEYYEAYNNLNVALSCIEDVLAAHNKAFLQSRVTSLAKDLNIKTNE